MNTTASASMSRIRSIDITRGLTMVLMIFVNDLWSLRNIPSWLEHVERGVDGIGLADTVFPAFLFIVGLSLPFALQHRRKKGQTQWSLAQHIILRSLALIIMGVFLVNGESLDMAAMGISRNLWYILSITGFILIWNQYPAQWPYGSKAVLRITGGVLLCVLAILYRGGGEGGTIEYFQPHWWGILGLIGWAYLASGLVTLIARERIAWICGAWVFFALLSMAYHAHWVPSFLSFIPATIRGGTETGLTMGGVLTALVFQHYHQQGSWVRMTLILLGFTVLLTVLSILTRPYWGLAKLGATPAWLFLCSAFTIWLFLAVYWIAEVYQKSDWFKVVLPAGTDTLLTYFIPYYAYALMYFSGWHLPGFLLEGSVGLVKSLLFALLCAWVAKILSRSGIKLKL